jgi:hypothetical protein
MSALDVANQQALAKFQNAQGQWLVMHWNTLSALASLNAVPVENKSAQQLTLPGLLFPNTQPRQP